MDDYIQMPSGLLLPESLAEARIKILQRPKAIDVFAGAGGMSLGMIQAGVEVVAAVDNWPAAAMTYMVNLGTYPCKFHFVEDSDHKKMETELQRQIKRSEKKYGVARVPVAGSGWISNEPSGTPGVGHFFLGDVRKLSGRDILEPLGLKPGELDMLAGGPPCQGFSRAGKRDVMNPRNILVFDFARLVCEIRPKTMIMENVPGIVDMDTPEGVPVIDKLGRILEDGGFGAHDAFLRSIEAQTGTVGLLRGKKKKKNGQKSESPRSTENQPKQIGLFG